MPQKAALLLILAAPALGDFCCWSSRSDSNVCGACDVGARLSSSNWCGRSQQNCWSCNRTWCNAANTPTREGGAPITGGEATRAAFEGWLGIWRDLYAPAKGVIPEVPEAGLPQALRGTDPIVVVSSGGAAGGVVTEGMGYALMVEGAAAARGDAMALRYGLRLLRAWLGMVNGPGDGEQPRGGGWGTVASATQVETVPYGVSAIISDTAGFGASGVATWKYPLRLCSQANGSCVGSATDGDQDAIMGMIYLAAALEYPQDFVDMVMRAVISFASADLGFPDLYRTLPDGTKVFVPKGGSSWGGLLADSGKFKTLGSTACYSPGYFGPGHYRLFRDFAKQHWSTNFDAYLPYHLSGAPTTLAELTEAFDGAVTAGYNILYRSSCASGSTSNWVGVSAPCSDPDQLHCEGVPWAHTPYVDQRNGTCTASGTSFGAYGAEASRAPWRIAIDYILFPEESAYVPIYDPFGQPEKSIVFNAQSYLNRFARQYTTQSKCNGGVPGECLANPTHSPFKLAPAFDMKHGAPDIVCSGVPFKANVTWWGALLSYPSFTAFIAPFAPLERSESAAWLDTFASICSFSKGTAKGGICDLSYFGAGQEVIATMIMAGVLKALPAAPGGVAVEGLLKKWSPGATQDGHLPGWLSPQAQASTAVLVVGAAIFAAVAAKARLGRRHRELSSLGSVDEDLLFLSEADAPADA